jgi:hypothetical protein
MIRPYSFTGTSMVKTAITLQRFCLVASMRMTAVVGWRTDLQVSVRLADIAQQRVSPVTLRASWR